MNKISAFFLLFFCDIFSFMNTPFYWVIIKKMGFGKKIVS